MTTGYDREYAVPRYRPRWWAIGLTALAVTAAVAAAVAQEQAIDATVCRADHPTQCMCLTLLVEGVDAAGQAQLAAWIGQNPGWTIASIGKCMKTENV